jgi:hypothetical protein
MNKPFYQVIKKTAEMLMNDPGVAPLENPCKVTSPDELIVTVA